MLGSCFRKLAVILFQIFGGNSGNESGNPDIDGNNDNGGNSDIHNQD